MKPGRLSRGALLGALGGGAIAATLVAMAATYKVVRAGRLPGGGAAVKEVDVLGGVTLTVADERPGVLDELTALALAAVAGISLLTWLLLSRPSTRRPARFFGVSAVGALVLAVDELEGLHETLGYNLAFLPDLHGLAHPDDVVMAALAMLVAAFLLSFRELFKDPPSARFFLLAALVLFALGVGADAAELAAEEWLEVTAAAALLAAFGGAARRHARLPPDGDPI